jgi:hypothetical protein
MEQRAEPAIMFLCRRRPEKTIEIRTDSAGDACAPLIRQRGYLVTQKVLCVCIALFADWPKEAGFDDVKQRDGGTGLVLELNRSFERPL